MIFRSERRELMDRYILRTFQRAQVRRELDPALMAEWEAELRNAGMLEGVTL